MSAPLLSICIPTFNRAHLLEICLASVLPQVALLGDEVECVICDNASTDATQAVIARYRDQFPLRDFRNTTNLGVIGNITKCAAELAGGDFVWMIGDDDVLTTHAVQRLVDALKTTPEIDLVALNVAYAPLSERPTADAATGGVDKIPPKRLRRSEHSALLPFEQLLEGPCADFTAMYSLVLRRSCWQKEYASASTAEPFTSVESTYPHAAIVAKQLTGKPAALIAEPAVVIYEMPGEQFSWAKYRAICSLVFATKLFKLYEANGVSKQVLAPYYRYQLEHRSEELGDLLFNRATAGGLKDAITFSWMMRNYPILLLRAYMIALMHPNAPWLIATPLRGMLWLKQRLRSGGSSSRSGPSSAAI